jgi:vacuolar-type H+-ATPase subunit H
MKTAVEFLASVLSQTGPITEDDFNSLVEQAKEMEKEQIIEAYNESFLLRDKPYATAEKYYNETFKQ